MRKWWLLAWVVLAAATAFQFVRSDVAHAQVSTLYMCGQANGVWQSIATKPNDIATLPAGTVFVLDGACQTAYADLSVAVPAKIFYVLRTQAAQSISIWDSSTTPATLTTVTVNPILIWDASVPYTDDVVLYNGHYYVLLLPSAGITPGTETTLGQVQHWSLQPAMPDDNSQWMVIGKQDDIVTIYAQTTLRYGVDQNTPPLAGAQPCTNLGGCWSVVTFTNLGSHLMNNNLFGNPIINTAPKVVEILLTDTAQIVTVNGSDIPIPVKH